MPNQIVDFTNDFAAERQWNPTPAGNPHWSKVSPENPLAPDKSDYLLANTIGAQDRHGLENLPAGFGPVQGYIHQFAYNGVAADNIPGVTWEFVVSGVTKATATQKLDSSGADTAGQVQFTFSPALTETEFNNGSVRKISANGGGASSPDDPVFKS